MLQFRVHQRFCRQAEYMEEGPTYSPAANSSGSVKRTLVDPCSDWWFLYKIGSQQVQVWDWVGKITNSDARAVPVPPPINMRVTISVGQYAGKSGMVTAHYGNFVEITSHERLELSVVCYSSTHLLFS